MSKTIYFIAPYPHERAPSQRFRFEQYLALYEKEGFKTEVIPFINEATWQTLYQKGNFGKKALGIMGSFLRRLGLLFKLINADHIFIHREMAQIGPPIFEWILAKVMRKKYVYDFDDAIWLPNYSESNARFQRLKAYWKVNYCMKWAHTITAGNDYLADYARKYNKNVIVLPTTIDTENYHNRTISYNEGDLIIGWTGTHTTMHYLNDIIPILRELRQHYSFSLHVISNEAPNFNLDSLKFIQWNKATEIDDLLQFDIGIMPLIEDKWSNGKCGFKALQYMSLGIPTILSPVGVNQQIVQNAVNGIFASTPEDWRTALVQLLEKVTYRKEIGLEGQKRVKAAYSIKANWPIYKSLFS